MNNEVSINDIIIGIPIAAAILLGIYVSTSHVEIPWAQLKAMCAQLKAMLAGYKLINSLPGNITFVDFDSRKYMGIYDNFRECKKDLNHLLLDVPDFPANWYCNVVVYIGNGEFIQCYILNNKYIMFINQ